MDVTTPKQKHIILMLLHDEWKKQSDDIDTNINSLQKKSGLESYVFNLAIEAIRLDRYIDVVRIDNGTQWGDITNVKINDTGLYYLKEDGGYNAKYEKEQRQERKKKMATWIKDFAPITITTLTFIWTVTLFWIQEKSNESSAKQKASVDSLTRQVRQLIIKIPTK